MLLHDLVGGEGQRDEGIAPLGDPPDRLEAPRAGDPDRRVGLLERPGPDVHEPEVVVLPLEVEGARPGPRLHDEVVGLAVALPEEGRVDLVGVRLDAEPHHHAGDDAPARQHVEHRQLLGHPERVVVERERVPEDQDLHPARALGEASRDDVGRRHEAVGVLVVLVHAHRVEAERLGQRELLEVLLVEHPAARRIVEAVRQGQPGRLVVLLEVGRQVRPRHEVEADEEHRGQALTSIHSRARPGWNCTEVKA